MGERPTFDGTGLESRLSRREGQRPRDGFREVKRRKSLRPLVQGACIVAVIIAAASVFIVLNPPSPVAVIIDGLLVDYPNPQLINDTLIILGKAGYRTELYQGLNVTVELYSRLASLRPKLVLLRIHGGVLMYQGQRIGGVGFFAEPFEGGKYPENVLHYLGVGKPFFSNKEYFVATFVYLRDFMQGQFEGTTVIVMSCNSLEDEAMAKVFTDKGASAYIGWTGSVTPEHMDKASLLVLRKMIEQKMSAEEAVNQVSSEVGPDPFYRGELDIYMR